MDERIGDLLAWDRTVHREQPPQKISARELREQKGTGTLLHQELLE
jgi:hypothetical protein